MGHVGTIHRSTRLNGGIAMNALTRRTALVAGFSTFAIGRARAAEFTYKIGTDVPDAAPINIYARKAADQIRERTNGRLDLQLYPNNQLGGDPAMFSQFRAGALECFFLSGTNSLSTLIPKAAIYGLGFIYKNDAEVYSSLDGALGNALRKQIRAVGFYLPDKIWANGFRQITSSPHPIKSVNDLDGFKIRVPVSALWVSNFKALGASPTSLPFNDVYSALQTHVVDGQETPLALISTAKFYEVQKYCAMSNHMWDGWWCLFGKAAWTALPTDIQKVVDATMNENAELQRAALAEENGKLRQQLATQGLTFNDIDPAEFQAKLRASGYYSQWKQTFGDELWMLLEQTSGKLV